MIRRSERDSDWLLRHMFKGYLSGRYYIHPEDFWWGDQDLWDWSFKLGAWRWGAIFSSNLFMYSVHLIPICIPFHIFALILRPDFVHWYDFIVLNRSPISWIYFGLYGFAALGSFGLTVADYFSYRKAQKLL